MAEVLPADVSSDQHVACMEEPSPNVHIVQEEVIKPPDDESSE